MTEALGVGGGGQRFRWALALVLGLSPFGCFGGQTGQPISADGSGGCTAQAVNVPVDRAVRGVVPLDAAQALEGSYSRPLAWMTDLGVPLLDVETDELTLTFTYDGGTARHDPCAHGGPDIEMTIDVVTRDSELAESGTGWVSFYPEPLAPNADFGAFSVATPTSSITGALRRTESGTLVSGSLTTSGLPLPLRNGRFPPP